MRILAHATQQRLPFSECLLLIPLALEGHTGARPHGCRKVTIAGERENALRQRFTVTRSDRQAATVLLEDSSDLAMFGANKDGRTTGGGDAVECWARSDPPKWG